MKLFGKIVIGEKLKVIILTVLATLTVETFVSTVLVGFGVVEVYLGDNKFVIAQNVSRTDINVTQETTTTTTEETTTTTEETTTETEESTTSSKRKTTTKKPAATTTKNNVGDNDGGWVDGWY